MRTGVASITRRVLLACAVAALAAGTLGAPRGVALDVDPSVTAGRAMATRPSGPPQWLTLYSGAPGYIAYDREPENAYDAYFYVIRRTSDGSAVRRVSWAASDNPPTMTGHSVVRVVDQATAGGHVSVEDIETGTVTWQLVIPDSEVIIGLGETWVLTVPHLVSGHPVLRRPGRPDVTLESVPTFSLQQASSDGTSVALSSGSQVWMLDIDTAHVELLALGQNTEGSPLFTRRRLFHIAKPWNHDRLTWIDRTDGTTGSVQLAEPSTFRERYIPYGDGLALVSRDATNPLTYRVAPIDLTTGELGQDLGVEALGVASDGDGTLAVALGDGPTGRIVTIAANGETHEIATMPEVGKPLSALLISNGTIYGDFGYEFSNTGDVRRIAPDDPASWSPLLTNSSDPPAGRLDSANGDVVSTVTFPAYGPPMYRLDWAGGHREIPGYGFLGWQRDGSLLIRPDGEDAVVEEARTGTVRATVPYSNSLAVDNNILWKGPSLTGLLTRTDLATGQSTTVDVGVPGCNGGRLEVVDRFALVFCGLEKNTVVDLRGVLRPWTVPGGAIKGVGQPQLGLGAVARLRWLTSGLEPYAVAEVMDLGPSHVTKRFGLLYGPTGPPDPQLSLDRFAPRLAYMDPSRQARVVDLDWLTPAADKPSDRTAPTLVSIDGSPRAVPGDVTATWAFTDTTDVAAEYPSGLASYDVRVASAPAGTSPASWTQPADLQATTATHAVVPGVAGQDLCWSVRARDRADNASAWSPSRCTTTDQAAPVLTKASAGPRVTASAAATLITFDYAARDVAGVASYDVAYRSAGLGADLGAWRSPASWLQTTRTRQTLTLQPGGDVCFRVRARDVLGNGTAWSTPSCSAVPLTDRQVRVIGGLPRVSDTRASDRLVIKLTRAGQRVDAAKSTGRGVAVVVLHGPGQGTLEVYAGSRRLGRITLAARTWRRDIIVLASTSLFSGQTVSVRSLAGSALIDSIAVLR